MFASAKGTRLSVLQALPLLLVDTDPLEGRHDLPRPAQSGLRRIPIPAHPLYRRLGLRHRLGGHGPGLVSSGVIDPRRLQASPGLRSSAEGIPPAVYLVPKDPDGGLGSLEVGRSPPLFRELAPLGVDPRQ